MKQKRFFIFTAVVAALLVVTSCKKDIDDSNLENPLEVVSPDEVITFNLGIWDGYSDDNCENQICVLSDSVTSIEYSNYSHSYYSDGTYTGSYTYYYYYPQLRRYYSYPADLSVYLTEMLNFGLNSSSSDYSRYIASIGIVAGLTSINSIPTNGWSQTLSANAGEGYVVKAEGSTENFSFVSYSRIWIQSWIQGATGGVMGAVVQYQPNWKKIYTPKTRMPLNQVRVTFGQSDWCASTFEVAIGDGELGIGDGELGIYCAPNQREGYETIWLSGTINSTPCTNNRSRLYYYEGNSYSGEYNWEIQSSTQTITAIDLNAHTISGKVEQLMKEENRGYSNVPLTVTFDEATWTPKVINN